jgi:hypothetical protein
VLQGMSRQAHKQNGRAVLERFMPAPQTSNIVRRSARSRTSQVQALDVQLARERAR